ncbi:MAG: hypothetical protein ABR576_13765 [Thermoanaerobaculia bacterium]
MRAKAFALLIAVSAAIAGCRSTATGPVSEPPPGPGPGAVNPPPNPNPAPVTPPPVPVPTPGPSQAGYASGPDSMGSSSPPYPPAAAVPDQASPPPAVAARPHHDILKLKQAGLSDEFILNKIRTENVNYQLTTSEILELRSAGFSEGVLEEMLRSGKPPAAVAGAAVERKAEFPGLARVGRGFLGVFGTSTRDVGRLVVDGETISWFQSQDPEQNFSLYLKNVKEVFNTCVLRPGQNLCLEFGLVTYTGDEYKFRDPGWKNGDNRLVTEATTYFRQGFPNLFFTQRTESKL